MNFDLISYESFNTVSKLNLLQPILETWQPKVDSSSISLLLNMLPWVPDWAEIFGREAPLAVEIGFGNGKFLADLAYHHPEYNVIGVERAHNPLTWTEALIQKKSLKNVRIVQADALTALHAIFSVDSLTELHVNFSDPWHKKRHRHRRVINETFLEVATSRLKPDGFLYIATDIMQYAGEIGLALGNTKGLKNAYPTPWMTQRENPGIVTHYEQKALRVGRTCHYFKWGRTATASLPPIPTLNEEVMPNTSLQLPFEFDTIIEKWERVTLRNEGRIVNILEIFKQPHKPILLFETFIQEPLINQRMMLALVKRRSGDYLLQMTAVGYPRPTRGVHDAVHHLGEWLASLHDDAKILSTTVNAPD